MRDIASPLKIKRKMKSHILTRQKKDEITYLDQTKDLPKMRHRLVERKGEVLLENSTDAPKVLSESRESQPEERKDEASSSSPAIGVVQIEMTTS